METHQILPLTETFEGHAQQTENGVEYWLARDLQQLLGYAEWRNFIQTAISKAKTACEVSGHAVSDHFVDVNKLIQLAKGAEREIEDLMLTRYACYLIAQNGDPRKQEIAFAQTYFAIQTRRAELIEKRLLEAERVSARKKLTDTEKELSQVIFEQTGGNQNFDNEENEALYNRALNLLSHGKYAIYDPTEMGEDNKILSRKILNDFITRFQFDLPQLLATQPAPTST